MQSFRRSISLVRLQSNRMPLVPKQGQLRLQHSQSTPTGSSEKFGSFRNTLVYTISITVGAGLGIASGKYLFRDDATTKDDPVKSNFLKRKIVEHTNSKYADFPFTIILYQYYSCPYCVQIRKYLDYFGFNYHLVEVDSFSKKTLSKFTLARELPILVLKDKESNSEWHLTNATATLSAMESLRCDTYENFDTILTKYLPTLVGNRLLYYVNPYKYYVSNSDINDVEWRRWINNRAVPALRLASISSVKNLFETFDYYSRQSDWEIRYNPFKFYYVYYSNAFWTYTRYNELLNKFATKKKPMQILKEIVTEWENGLNGKKFMGGNSKPNLADLAMFSTAFSYEGLSFYRKLVDKHPTFKSWYDRMKTETEAGPEQRVTAEKRRDEIMPLEAATAEESTQTLPKDIEVIKDKTPQTKDSTTSTANKEFTTNVIELKIPKDSISALRILSFNYLIHVVAFTYASWSAK